MITRIRRCNKKFSTYKNHEILHKCLDTSDKPIQLTKTLGQGTFGTVYSADYRTTNGKDIKIAVKTIETDLKNRKLNDVIDDITWEVEYSYYMANLKIGPKIHDSFYIVNDKEKKVVCYILMEAFDSSIGDIYDNDSFSDADYKNIHSEMLEILHKQIFKYDMFCVDIKPENYVIKKESDKFKIRIIDYGADWCSLNNMLPEYISKDFFYLIILIQLCLMTKSVVNSLKISKKVLKPFVQDPIYKKYMHDPIKVIEVLYNALLSDNSPVHDKYLCYALNINKIGETKKFYKKLATTAIKTMISLSDDINSNNSSPKRSKYSASKYSASRSHSSPKRRHSSSKRVPSTAKSNYDMMF